MLLCPKSNLKETKKKQQNTYGQGKVSLNAVS